MGVRQNAWLLKFVHFFRKVFYVLHFYDIIIMERQIRD